MLGPHKFFWRVKTWFKVMVGSVIRVGGRRRPHFSKGPRKDRKARVCVALVNPNHNPFAQMLKGMMGLTCCI